ncbi:hypothetical protein [Nakamurella leprariae]|uniref:Ig-like domain-containing protein n=1 Tax=Nakamurella leprariae TaxID=2803911 RepID=A0A938Y5C6_9ACTN|nr:hypothetical protein [Nakamurella leprariae]MBM9466336.1 hypothetical protein [Nakamurella leprariae]
MKRNLLGFGGALMLAGAAAVIAPGVANADEATCTSSVNYKTVTFTCDAPDEARKVEVKLECNVFGVLVAGSEHITVPAGGGYWQEMFCPEGSTVGDYGWWDRGAA